ncbi:MAG: hypothetical protein HKN28_13005 [Alphaproteobacteria bacterium]|nr:hypothetical protein [Alphaproteobacteria bacterium]
MLRRLIHGAVVGFALLLLAAPITAQAQNLPVDAFYGHFQGSGIAENEDSLYFGVTVRDLDVRIGPEADGFYVEWTSVIRGGGDPNNPDIRKRSARVAFSPSERPNVFLSKTATNPMKDGLIWARVLDQTLTVNVMRVNDEGSYIVQTYNRTLSGTGMTLNFVNTADGEPLRQVEARLVKVGN